MAAPSLACGRSLGGEAVSFICLIISDNRSRRAAHKKLVYLPSSNNHQNHLHPLKCFSSRDLLSSRLRKGSTSHPSESDRCFSLQDHCCPTIIGFPRKKRESGLYRGGRGRPCVTSSQMIHRGPNLRKHQMAFQIIAIATKINRQQLNEFPNTLDNDDVAHFPLSLKCI